MASKSLSAPLLRAVATRTYATACPKPACSAAPVEVSKTSKQTAVVTSDCSATGVAKVAVAVKAGSRYETPDVLGVSHVLRSASGLTTKDMTQFKIQKTLQTIGANLTATSDRETIIYTLDSKASELPKALDVLKSIIQGQVFKPWEVSDNIGRIKEELARLPAPAKVLDLVHQAAFRSGLGNSIFAKEFDLKSLDAEAVKHYYAHTFFTNRMAVAATGVDHGTLADFAEEFELENGKVESNKTKYYGGDLRLPSNSKVTYVAIAGEGRGFNKKDVFSFATLQYAFGGVPSVSYGNPSGPLGSAISGIEGVSSQAFSCAHSDAGLFGILIAANDSAKAGDAVRAAVKALRKGITEDEFKRGKAKLQASILFGSESTENLSHDLATQALYLGSAKSPCEISKSIDEVTYASVSEALKKVLSSNLSLAAVGRVTDVPYLDEL